MRFCGQQKQPPEVFYKKLIILQNSQKKHLCRSFFFKKVANLRLVILLKKRLRHSRFPVDFAKFFITAFLRNTSERLHFVVITIACTGL